MLIVYNVSQVQLLRTQQGAEDIRSYNGSGQHLQIRVHFSFREQNRLLFWKKSEVSLSLGMCTNHIISSSVFYLLLVLRHNRGQIVFCFFSPWKHKDIKNHFSQCLANICCGTVFMSVNWSTIYTYWNTPGSFLISTATCKINHTPAACQKSPRWCSRWEWRGLCHHLGEKAEGLSEGRTKAKEIGKILSKKKNEEELFSQRGGR